MIVLFNCPLPDAFNESYLFERFYEAAFFFLQFNFNGYTFQLRNCEVNFPLVDGCMFQSYLFDLFYETVFFFYIIFEMMQFQ